MLLCGSLGSGGGYSWGARFGVCADVAQLVERNLAKVEVASSSLVVRFS